LLLRAKGGAVVGGQKKPYDQRTDLEKIESNWSKIAGLFERREWSSAIVRAATSCEIAANLAIREELQVKCGLDAEFVDSLLKWANGIRGKVDRLLLPATKGQKLHSRLRKLTHEITRINDERNDVAHRGAFKKKAVAKEVIAAAKRVVLGVAKDYHHGLQLEDIK
jgi:hypothetical protein